MRLQIGKPEIVEEGGFARLNALCMCDEWGAETFYFEVPCAFRDTLCTERIDAFVVGFLTWAMWKSYSVEEVEIVSNYPVSEQLLFQLEETYIPVVCRQLSDRYAKIRFTLPTDSNCINDCKSVATGVSGGVDSTYNVLKLTHLDDGLLHHRLDYGVCCDFGSLSGVSRSEKSKALVGLTNSICNMHAIGYIPVNSNFTEKLYGMAHAAIIDPLIVAHALALQKRIGIYYIGSTYLFEEFAFNPEDVSQFELFIATYLSTQDLRFYTIGSEVTRFEKTKYIAGFEEPKHYLMPCSATSTDHCCSRCSKCTRTMSTLWCLDKLDDYREVFDVDSFYRDMNYHLGYLIMRRDYHFNKEILDECRRTGHKVSASAWISAFVKWAKRGFKARNPLASSYRPK